MTWPHLPFLFSTEPDSYQILSQWFLSVEEAYYRKGLSED